MHFYYTYSIQNPVGNHGSFMGKRRLMMRTLAFTRSIQKYSKSPMYEPSSCELSEM